MQVRANSGHFVNYGLPIYWITPTIRFNRKEGVYVVTKVAALMSNTTIQLPPNFCEVKSKELGWEVNDCFSCKYMRIFGARFTCVKYCAFVSGLDICDSYKDGRIDGFPFLRISTTPEVARLLRNSEITDLEESEIQRKSD